MESDKYCRKHEITYPVEVKICPMCNKENWKKARHGKPWTEQFFPCETIGPEPPMNRQGYWTKPKVDELVIETPEK